MRRQVLLRSIQRLLPGGLIIEAAWMWQPHRLLIPMMPIVGVVVAVAAIVVGFERPSAIAIGVAGVAVLASASTHHRVLVTTDAGVRLLRGSRIRRTALERLEDPDSAAPFPVANRFVMTEWNVGGATWSVPKSSEAAMVRIATAW